MKIRILSIASTYWLPEEVLARSKVSREHKKDPETEIIHRRVEKGTTNIASRSDRTIAGFYLIKETLRLKEEVDFDAVVINCFADTGADELREILNVPVLGPCQACVHVASLLGRRFSIVTVDHYAAETLKDLVAHYGFSEKLASVRYLGMPPLEIGKHLKEEKTSVVEKFVKIAKTCIEEDDADVIIPGCGYFGQIVEDVRKDLDTVVLDPIEVPIRMLESLVKMEVKPSKKVFPAPTKEQLKQYRL